MKYNVGDVIGTVTLVVHDIDEIGVSLMFEEVDCDEMQDIIDNYLDPVVVESLSFKLDPSKRKEMLLKQRADIDKQLEELGND